jgi:hypothetical protein
LLLSLSSITWSQTSSETSVGVAIDGCSLIGCSLGSRHHNRPGRLPIPPTPGNGFQPPAAAENATGILRATGLRCNMYEMRRSRSPYTAAWPWRGRTSLVAACALALLPAPTLWAQASVELRVPSSSPYVNENVSVSIVVTNAGEIEPPEFPALSDCTVQEAGTASRQMFSSDSRTGRPVSSREDSYNFILIPHKPGPLVIPAIPVVVDGKILKTEPVKLMVREVPESPRPRGGPPDETRANAETDELLLAEITCDQPTLYVGQRASFTLSVWIKPAEHQGQELSQRDMRQFLTGRIGPFDLQSERDRKVYRQMADNSRQPYYLIEFTGEMTLDQPGALTFDDVSLGMDYPTGFSRTRFWGDLRVTERRPLRIRPTVTAPEVQPLPSEGRPASFSGAVGQYEIDAFAVPTNVRVGDPIQLVIDISGEPIETIPGPDLGTNAELNEDFRVPTETLAGTVRGNSKRFTQVIRAKRADVKNIPPLEFSYFDPQTGQYVVARSKPIPILVSVVEQLDAADLTNIAAQPAQPQNLALQARDGLRGNKTREADLLASTPTITMTRVVLTTSPRRPPQRRTPHPRRAGNQARPGRVSSRDPGGTGRLPGRPAQPAARPFPRRRRRQLPARARCE